MSRNKPFLSTSITVSLGYLSSDVLGQTVDIRLSSSFYYCQCLNRRCLHLSISTLPRRESLPLRLRPHLEDYTCPSISVQTATHLHHRPLQVHYLLVSIYFFFDFSHFIYTYDSALATTSPSYVYSRDALLSLLPFADESMKGKMRVNCPEVVMNRKTRKGLEFNGRRTELLVAQHLLTQEPTLSGFNARHGVIHNKNPTPTLQTSTTLTARVLPRRSRPAGRVPERRRNAFASTFGARRTGEESWRLQAVPMSPIILV